MKEQNKNYLFLFTIGPVQSFIAQARKTQDLWAGSYLLSYLVNTAMSFFPKENIIFPNPEIESKPNRFIAKIDEKLIIEIAEKLKITNNDINNIGKELEKKVKEKFIEMANQTLSNKKINKPESFDKQIADFLQIFWIALEYNEQNYAEKFQEIENFLGAIKNIRVFKQMGEIGRKCSLCGERNVLFCKKDSKNRLQIKPNWKQLNKDKEEEVKEFNNSIKEIIDLSLIKENEGLCAVCFTKRFYKLGPSFPSTAKIALMFQIYKDEKNIKDFNYDAQLFYDENLTENYFRKNGISEKVEEVKKQRDNILKRLKLKPSELTKYYAIIAFDGDSMGKWLSGERIKDKSELEDFHSELSKKLGEFSKNAKKILDEKNRGRTIYAGGDDFLGFVNLFHLFDVMKELREKFKLDVSDNLKKYFNYEKDEITFSAGIAIAHYKTPLSIVLSWARKMEKEAKEIDDDKNAFGIAVIKHSGEIRKSVYKWYFGEDKILTKNIKDIFNALHSDKFSSTFIINLNREFTKLLNEQNEYIGNSKWLITEINRLIKRANKMKNTKKLDQEEFKREKEKENSDLIGNIKDLYNSAGKRGIINFLNILNIINFLNKEL